MPQTIAGLFADDAIDNINQIYADITNVSQKVLDYNIKRRFLILSNDSNEVMYVSFGVPAEMHKGLRLEPGTFIMFSLCTTTLYQGSIHAIQSLPIAKRLLVTEGT